jgi:hypothetical protein
LKPQHSNEAEHRVCKIGIGSGDFQHVASRISTNGSETSHVSCKQITRCHVRLIH